jgi:signal transduction histidine kinase
MVTATRRLRRTFAILTVCTLAVFAALLFGLTAVLRQRLRAEVLRREGESIHAVALMEIGAMKARLEKAGVEISTADIFTAVLEWRLGGVLAVQLFDPAGALREALPAIPNSVAERDHWWPAPLAHSAARYHPKASLEDIFGFSGDAPDAEAIRTPLLEVVIPLAATKDGASLGVARYWIDGTPLQAEFARLDTNLLTQAGIAFLGGSALIGLLLAWTYRRLAGAQEQLLKQSADLARANQELDFAAKTGALGAISAHLIHGLKNPLAGLEEFVAEAAANDHEPLSGEARQTAVETARRVRNLVNEVVTVLRDEAAGTADYPVALREVVDAAQARIAAAAQAAGIELEVTVTSDSELRARTGSLAGLVLANLLTNAIEASPRGGAVRLEASRNSHDIHFLVTDQGGGLPDAVRDSLFRPVMSTKRGGGGMGLAISSRLARHAGGELELVRSDREGTAFRLRVPFA